MKKPIPRNTRPTSRARNLKKWKYVVCGSLMALFANAEAFTALPSFPIDEPLAGSHNQRLMSDNPQLLAPMLLATETVTTTKVKTKEKIKTNDGKGNKGKSKTSTTTTTTTTSDDTSGSDDTAGEPHGGSGATYEGD